MERVPDHVAYPQAAASPRCAADELAFNAVTRWQAAVRETTLDGVDYAPMVQGLLWWRVARAIRSAAETVESTGGGNRESRRDIGRPIAWLRGLRRSLSCTTSTLWRAAFDARSAWRTDQTQGSFAPLPHRRWNRTRTSLRSAFPDLRCGQRIEYRSFASPAASGVEFCNNLIDKVVEQLAGVGVVLTDWDRRELQSELVRRYSIVNRLRRRLARQQRGVIVIPNESDSPYAEALAVAKSLGIPTVLIQHGLDCDRDVYDRSEAQYVAVWGPERPGRYLDLETARENIRVVGNPEYDLVSPPSRLQHDGEFWLWATRPHSIRRCLTPSRSPLEGGEILEAIIEALERNPNEKLVIKPHRYDDVALCERRLANSAVRERVTIQSRGLGELLPSASLVITEDTTAALDAAFCGKPMVHAHFTDAPPVLPLVDMGAALSGFDHESLVASLSRLVESNTASRREMADGQQAFIAEFHPLTGNATERLTDFLIEAAA